jgi:glycosidase
MSHNREPWWKTGVVYQVYPRSFQDTTGDGVGDLAGVLARLDYLKDLGIDAIWLSPIFPSPMADFGYDVADYCNVDPRFGTLADIDRLIAAAHERGLRLLLDFVPNHSSDQHAWFKESRSSRDNPKRDWYIWRDAKPDGGVPNNWISDFGGSSWEWDAATGQYYLHAFLKEQPDLNWRNPDLRAAMMDVLRFWFDRGIDGFRIDVLWHIIKAEGFPDNPPKVDHVQRMGELFDQLQVYNTNQPEVHEISAEMRELADGYEGDRVLIGEIYLPFNELVRYYGTPERPEVLPFNFGLINVQWSAEAVHALIAEYEAALPPGGWPNWVLGNHDRPRIAHRVGETQARVAAMLLLTLRGTPTVYYGDELGLPNVKIPPDRAVDPAELRQPGKGIGRDPVRSPMPWDTGTHGGFTTGEPWLPMNPDWPTRNVAVEAGDDGSMLTLHKRLLALRRAHRALQLGDIYLLPVQNGVLAYERRLEGETLLVTLNLTGEAASWAVPPSARPLLSTLSGDPATGGVLQPNEGIVWVLER